MTPTRIAMRTCVVDLAAQTRLDACSQANRRGVDFSSHHVTQASHCFLCLTWQKRCVTRPPSSVPNSFAVAARTGVTVETITDHAASERRGDSVNFPKTAPATRELYDSDALLAEDYYDALTAAQRTQAEALEAEHAQPERQRRVHRRRHAAGHYGGRGRQAHATAASGAGAGDAAAFHPLVGTLRRNMFFHAGKLLRACMWPIAGRMDEVWRPRGDGRALRRARVASSWPAIAVVRL